MPYLPDNLFEVLGDLKPVVIEGEGFHVSLRNETTGGIIDFQGYMAFNDGNLPNAQQRMVHMPRSTPHVELGKHFYTKRGYHGGNAKYLFGCKKGERKLDDSTLNLIHPKLKSL